MPLQVPCVEVSTTDRCAVPEIVGAVVLTGGVAVTVAVGLLDAVAVPSAFVAITSRRTASPSSATASV